MSDVLFIQLSNGTNMTKWQLDWSGVDLQAEATAVLSLMQNDHNLHAGATIDGFALVDGPGLSATLKSRVKKTNECRIHTPGSEPAGWTEAMPSSVILQSGDARVYVPPAD